MLIFNLESQTTDEVTRIFEILQALISLDIYKNLFQIILTDNGHEFFDVSNIEYIHSTGKYVTHLFFLIHMLLVRKVPLNKIMNSLDIFYLKVPLSKILLKKTAI